MKYVRRALWFTATRVLILTVITAILVCAFYMSMNIANIYIIVSDGLKKRVDVILTQTGAEDLTDYFHADFLSNDAALQGAFDGSSAFGAYNITGYDYVLQFTSLWAWPWDDTATASLTEQVNSIKGTALASRRSEVSAEVPKWQGGAYDITLTRVDGKWKIISMKQTGIIVDEATPSPTASPAGGT